jgi:hypothetical protein
MSASRQPLSPERFRQVQSLFDQAVEAIEKEHMAIAGESLNHASSQFPEGRAPDLTISPKP